VRLALLPFLYTSLTLRLPTVYSEAVSAEKYPAYAAYQRRVGMFLPLPDTLVRTIYYRLFASKEARAKTEADVWGAPVSGAKSAKAQ
jgi:hypothetical protein